MKIFETHTIEPKDLELQERDWIYNGLDSCITSEILDILLPQLDNTTNSTYAFSKALQGPVLEMRLRGVLVDQSRKSDVIDQYHEKLDLLENQLCDIVGQGLGLWGFNWRSNRDLHELFYDRLKIPPIRRGGRPTVNRDALEEMEAYIVARPIVRHLKTLREIGKRVSVLKTEIDSDGRIRTSYNIAGTETGRFSSSFSEFGTGGNLQNIEDNLRSMLIADPGMKLGYFDAKSGESFCVGAIEWNLFKDGKYLDACETGDPHTQVARWVWPELGWNGNYKHDRAIADGLYYRHRSRRDICKNLGHGTTYKARPPTLSSIYHVPLNLVQAFQPKLFTAFPAHLRWHAHVENELRRFGVLVSLTGRRRHFFGRRDSDETLREAIAYDPQGSLSDIVNSGMLQVWRAGDCQLLMQNHDAIVVQYREEEEDDVVPKIISLLAYRVELSHSRVLEIPYGCKTGWNFGNWSVDNPDGLKDYVPCDERKRTPPVPILDRRVYRLHR